MKKIIIAILLLVSPVVAFAGVKQFKKITKIDGPLQVSFVDGRYTLNVASGKVGVLDENPSTTLSIGGGSDSDIARILKIGNSGAGFGTEQCLEFAGDGNISMGGVCSRSSLGVNGNLKFYTGIPDGKSEKMTILNNGDVFIKGAVIQKDATTGYCYKQTVSSGNAVYEKVNCP